MAFQYSAEFKYKISDNDGKPITVPIGVFSVGGGPSRSIFLRQGNDVSITSEMEQARMHKNIDLGMLPMPGTADMKVVIDLTDAAKNNKDLDMDFYVFKFSDGKPVEGLHLSDGSARMMKSPVIKGGYLSIFLKLTGGAQITRIMYNPGKKPKSFPM